ncbi:acetylcholine receptor subunit alpha-type acr-16-like [Eurosta solidaginis]|uniref:acetylcholine receptor subunit alpha-type acr-16-like n=1 Tax=Eurosta solidaginis TaxID=178769 RepID=UPI0035305A96
MLATEDGDDQDQQHTIDLRVKNLILQNFNTSKSYYNYAEKSNSNIKQTTTYLHFLRKTRRKNTNQRFKALWPAKKTRQCQTLNAFYQTLLVKPSTLARAAEMSVGARIISNTHIINNQLDYRGAWSCREMKEEREYERYKKETSFIQQTAKVKNKENLYSRHNVSATYDRKLQACEVKAQFKYSCIVKSCNCRKSYFRSRSDASKRGRFFWKDIRKSCLSRSNNRATNGSFHRRSHINERLCTRKKRRLRRRRKRKELNIEIFEDHLINKRFYEQLTTTTNLALVVTSNATEFHKSALIHSQQAQIKRSPTKTTEEATIHATATHNNTPTCASTVAQLAKASCIKSIIKNHLLPATASLPKKVIHSHESSNKNSCNNNVIGVQQHVASSNRLATIKACHASTKFEMSTTASSMARSSSTSTAHPAALAIRLPAFYAVTTLRLFLTTLTTLIASSTPTTFTTTKYSWLFLWIYVNLTARVALAGYHEKRLLHDLLDPYNTLERPVLNESDPLQLSFGLTLMQIIDVDEKNQLLVTNVWLKLEWNDMNLRWNTSDYGGVKDLRIPPHRIWKPDVLMYNSADEGFDGTYQTNVVVRNNGSCLYVPPGIFKSTCKIDITWFPFDDQRCEMKFGSWTYDGFQLDLQLQDETGGDISSYVLNGEWELLGVPGKRNEIYYNCCPEPYIDITFAIIIRRRTLYYFFNLIIPCVLIASMALLGFTLPPDSGEKLSLGVTILLSLTVFLNMVAETMPATSDAVPLLGTYFNCIMFMVASSVVSTILILNYHHRNADTHEMSEWIRIVFLCWLPWILRMSRPGRPLILEFPTTPCSDTSSERKHQILSDVELKERSSKSLLANVLDIDDDFRHNCRPMTPAGTLPHNPAFYRTVYGQGDDGSIGPIGSTRMPDAVTHHTCIKSATEYELGLILKEIRFITDQLRKEDEENDIANDWKFAAMVVDRLCLIIFTMFTILATIAVLLSAPHIIVS